jgi:hypothetical protein
MIMHCIDNLCEIDYYSEILDFYEKTSEYGNLSYEEIEKWSEQSYIQLMNEVKENKVLNDAPMIDVAKNSIILILNLFDKKCQIQSDIPLDQLSDEDKGAIKEALNSILD